jgi:hypothetical protein
VLAQCTRPISLINTSLSCSFGGDHNQIGPWLWWNMDQWIAKSARSWEAAWWPDGQAAPAAWLEGWATPSWWSSGTWSFSAVYQGHITNCRDNESFVVAQHGWASCVPVAWSRWIRSEIVMRRARVAHVVGENLELWYHGRKYATCISWRTRPVYDSTTKNITHSCLWKYGLTTCAFPCEETYRRYFGLNI